MWKCQCDRNVAEVDSNTFGGYSKVLKRLLIHINFLAHFDINNRIICKHMQNQILSNEINIQCTKLNGNINYCETQ